jgi:hypothetical protein
MIVSERGDMGEGVQTERQGSYFADGTKRLQRNFGITEDIAEWLRVASFMLNRSQSDLAREAFSLLREQHPDVRVGDV